MKEAGFITECITWECFLSEGQSHRECELVFDTLGGHTSWGKEHMTVFGFKMKKFRWRKKRWRIYHIFTEMTFSFTVALVVRLPLSTSPSRYEREENVFIFYAVLTEMNQDVFKLMFVVLFFYITGDPHVWAFCLIIQSSVKENTKPWI